MIRKLLPAALLTASLSGCGFSGIHTSEPMRYYIFSMPEVHDIGKEYLICIDTLRNGTLCRLNNGIEGRYEFAHDTSFLDFPNDSTIQWPNHDEIGPKLIRRSH